MVGVDSKGVGKSERDMSQCGQVAPKPGGSMGAGVGVAWWGCI